jgi:hypothetical protein
MSTPVSSFLNGGIFSAIGPAGRMPDAMSIGGHLVGLEIESGGVAGDFLHAKFSDADGVVTEVILQGTTPRTAYRVQEVTIHGQTEYQAGDAIHYRTADAEAVRMLALLCAADPNEPMTISLAQKRGSFDHVLTLTQRNEVIRSIVSSDDVFGTIAPLTDQDGQTTLVCTDNRMASKPRTFLLPDTRAQLKLFEDLYRFAAQTHEVAARSEAQVERTTRWSTWPSDR